MTGAELLTAGKAVLWFGLPLLLAVLELRRTRGLQRRGRTPGADDAP